MLDKTLPITPWPDGVTRCHAQSPTGMRCTAAQDHLERNLPHTAHGGAHDPLLVWTDTAHWHPSRAGGFCGMDVLGDTGYELCAHGRAEQAVSA